MDILNYEYNVHMFKVKGPSAYWTKLSSAAAPIPRYLHCSYGVISNDGSNVSVFIFGGITESGTTDTVLFYKLSIEI